MNNFFKVPDMSQNRLIWVGIDLTSVPAKFGGPGTSRTVTIAMFQNCPNFSPKGSFTYDVITLGGGGGGFQMMTIDDEGEGGVLANDDVITGTTIFGKFLGFSKNFSTIFL